MMVVVVTVAAAMRVAMVVALAAIASETVEVGLVVVMVGNGSGSDVSIWVFSKFSFLVTNTYMLFYIFMNLETFVCTISFGSYIKTNNICDYGSNQT